MAVRFFDTQDAGNPANGKTITSESELRELLNSLRYRDPFFCELVAPNASKLLLGIGSDIGCAQYGPSDGSPPYLMAAAATEQPADSYAEFLTADTPSPVPIRYCLPLKTTLDIAAYFVETGEPWPGTRWEDI
jgi:hypothetical protein